MDKKENLPISVCICTLNCIEEIKNCLEAVFRNNISEVIVVDAESNDGTFQFLRSQPVKLISCPRLGLAYQRQLSIENASKELDIEGSHGTFLDAKSSKSKCINFAYGYC